MQENKFQYQGQEIDFVLTDKTDVMVNATEMAKAFGKRIDVFLKTDTTKEFIKTLEKFLAEQWVIPHRLDSKIESEFPPIGGNSTLKIIQTKGHMGTYFHRLLALKFAAWLDPRFELWVYQTIDNILFGPYIEWRHAQKEKLQKERQLNIKRQQLAEQYPEFLDYF